MSIYFKSVVFVIVFTNFKVTGVDFTISRERVLLGSTGTLTMTCDVSETDVDTVYLIQIRRTKSTTSSGSDPNDWQTLALMQLKDNESPTLAPEITAIADTKDYVAGGLWDSDTPANTFLTLSLNMEKLVCDEARTYKCFFSYKSTTSGTIASVERNATFSAYGNEKEEI
ncbi:uncharacterized protein LOC132751726 [Ruditapes philippinarum]|uniref:uncharacterized protein LOC132751726 n=1 Tax=Ruditapes philippinarum TaxID=129788 RepID=UPI00295AC5DA|nr:uncharacterized protein LOC132751726 [Ruditapes philippinarum]